MKINYDGSVLCNKFKKLTKSNLKHNEGQAKEKGRLDNVFLSYEKMREYYSSRNCIFNGWGHTCSATDIIHFQTCVNMHAFTIPHAAGLKFGHLPTIQEK